MKKDKYYRHIQTRGAALYWIILIYIIIGAFYPVIGFLAFICMVAPVAFAVRRGRWWCGNACPRGNLYDRVLSKYSPHRQIPGFVRTFGFRLFMVFFIFAVFGIQMYFAWGDWAAMGRVFWRIIVITTIAGVALSFIYAPRTWCSFCPMGTLSAWVTPRKGNLPERYRRVMVSNRCTTKCQTCAKVCPMQLAPYTSKGDKNGLLDKDCLKCGRCVYACPLKVPVLSDAYTGTQN